jgi:spore coat protein A
VRASFLGDLNPLFQSRRTFLQQASALAVFAKSRWAFPQQQGMQHQMGSKPSPPKNEAPPALPQLHSLELEPFVDELPLPPLIIASEHHQKLRIAMREIHAKLHRDVPETRMWSYGETPLAPLIEARSHQTLHVEWVNQLPQHHFLPIDYALHGCGRDVPEVRANVHLHGGRTPSKDDGQPEDWYVPGQSRVCTYPLQQDATALWYHDHAMGLNRLNIYAGLVGTLLLRDEAEDRLGLPSGPYELPLTLYDRDFTTDGQLSYPVSPDPNHPWVSEFLADAILINGKIRPYALVEPRLYRLRMLNAANSRFFELSFTTATTPGYGQPIKRQKFQQIGADQGLLAEPVTLEHINFAPAERADLLVDFSQFAGQQVYLRNGAMDIVEFRVAAGTPQPAKALPAELRAVPRPDVSLATTTRTITLNEYQDKVGNSMMMLLNRKHWHEPVTETPKLNSTEIWEFVNLTEDVHPMHLHLVRFQILDRRVFDPFAYLMHKQLKFLAAATPPEANEAGWKDVVQCPPGMITRILVTFNGYAGRYLYHCHILEHESNDMMRPFDVIA